MLVLSRMRDEGIILPEQQIHIVISDIRGDKVRIGINAPREIRIYRDEVWRTIQREQAAAEAERAEREAIESCIAPHLRGAVRAAK